MAEDISFIIPSYNDASGLERHFRYFSAARQPAELIVVDDCSTDGTGELVRSTEMPPGVRLVYHRMEENGGPGAARNKGVELVTRDYAMFLDADDLLSPCFFPVMRQAPFGPQVDFVMFKYHLSRDPERRFTYEMHQVDSAFFSGAVTDTFPVAQFRLSDRLRAAATVNFPWNKLYRTAFLREAGIAFPDLRMHEDIAPHWQSFMRCRLFGVLYWAPPLITHYEIPKGTRATQYVGEKRMGVFEELSQVEAELQVHPNGGPLMPVFGAFCNDLFTWMAGPLCSEGGADGLKWRPRYQAAAEEFWKKSAAMPPGGHRA